MTDTQVVTDVYNRFFTLNSSQVYDLNTGIIYDYHPEEIIDDFKKKGYLRIINVSQYNKEDGGALITPDPTGKYIFDMLVEQSINLYVEDYE